ncbi:MAG TPA: molybdopterin-dependent oxidoreductase [Solirubrobacteraceae bacterium]|jgi:NADH-quinone oxidoreductase subunit G|nr:molybdopterin-dependent oxidoreductase [Solirubrobacteraceae bacterium]
MPRPEQRMITFTIDGREVTAPENAMLVDAAKYGDVEIPVFCYEPKLGNPVGACRMCLVEIEGIPKLQTGCSTPAKDGMVVNTQSQRVKVAQQAVVEFLLVNHPLDCPVCDKGGECPLQDITFGWGAGTSRFIEPKRHFVKPLALSERIAIDRERCILCYRCVRFSQEISEDYQLVLVDRGAQSFVATFDGHPYEATFSGNIIELCPVGALTSRPYRFRARPWDIEDAGSVCTLCPSQCNVTLTVRDERVMRVLARENGEVDDGWLCDRGRFAYPALGGLPASAAALADAPPTATPGNGGGRITEPMIRDGGQLRVVSWERAMTEAVAGLRRAGARVGAIVGGQATNEEGLLLARLMREGAGSPHVDSRAAGTLARELHLALNEPRLQAKVSDLEFAHAVLVLDSDPIRDAPILDLRLRKGVRRHGMKLISATREELLRGPRELASKLGAEGEEIVVLWAERLTAGPDGDRAAAALLELAQALSLGDVDGGGLLEIPAHANGRGLREAGVLPNAGPGLADTSDTSDGNGVGRDATGIAQGLAAGELTALYLLQSDPLLEPAGRELWERALARAATVVAHASFLSEGVREHADVVFPSESYAEKEGTITHPDGRLQRLRPAVAHPGATRSEWSVIAELASRLGLDLEVLSGAMASAQLFETVPFYAGLTLEEIGGKGVRWQEREAAAAYPGREQLV